MTASPLDPPLSLFLMAGSKAQCPGKRFAQRPRGWGWAGPGAPWRGLGRELQPFYALCVPGSHFHFYRKGFLLPLTKLVFSCLISERVRHTMSSKAWMWGQVQRRDSAHACLHIWQAASQDFLRVRAFLGAQGPAPGTSPGSGHRGRSGSSRRTQAFASSLLQACPSKSLTVKA